MNARNPAMRASEHENQDVSSFLVSAGAIGGSAGHAAAAEPVAAVPGYINHRRCSSVGRSRGKRSAVCVAVPSTKKDSTLLETVGRRCPILESGLVGSLVDNISEEKQKPETVIRHFPRSAPDLAVTDRPRPAFCVVKKHGVRPVTKNTRCNATSGTESKP